MAQSHPTVIRVQNEAFDDPAFPLGIIRIATDRTITYLNRAIGAMVGADLRVGMQITDLPLEPDSCTALSDALHARFEQHRGTGYPLVLRRTDNGTLVRCHVAAVPEYGEDGHLTGSIGFVVDQSRDLTAAAIYREMEGSTRPVQLLRRMARHLRDVLAFDSLMVTVLSRDGLHLRTMFETPDPPDQAGMPAYRWWPMPLFIQTMVGSLRSGPFDLDTLYDNAEYARLAGWDHAVKTFRARNFRHSLRLSVRSEGRRVAILTLLRERGKLPFEDADLQLCTTLPVAGAISTALALDQQRQHRFAISLIKSLTDAGGDATEIARRLVDKLCTHFGWEHVSLFRVLRDSGTVRVVCQASDPRHRLPDDYTQDIDKGLLGLCLKTGATVNVGVVGNHAQYVVGMQGTQSEMVVPLPGPELTWLLNIESSTRDAFAHEEQRAVETLLHVTASILERTALLELDEAIIDNVGDAVIQTSETNVIRAVNLACTRLLGYARAQMVGCHLGTFLLAGAAGGAAAVSAKPATSDPWSVAQTGATALEPKAQALMASTSRNSEVLRFKRADGTPISMLVSTAVIPGQFGGKVFIASDLTGQQYLDRVGKLMPVFRQLASEIRVPLASAAALLEMAVEEDSAADRRAQLERAGQQVRRADVSVERVMQAAEASESAMLQRTAFDLRRVAYKLREEFALDTVGGLQIVPAEGPPLFVHAAYDQLLLCTKGLMAYLLRIRHQHQRIEIESGRDSAQRNFLALRLAGGDWPEPADVPLDSRARNADEIVMIESVVPTLVARMGGDYIAPSAGQSQFKLLLDAVE